MFTPEERDDLRRKLIEAARVDSRISGGAVTGSAALDAQDRWSDIDLAFGIEPAETLLDSETVARSSLDVIVSDLTGHVVDVRREAW